MDNRFFSGLRIIIIFILLGSVNCAEAVKSTKPTSPVTVNATLLNTPSDDGYAEINVEVSSSLASSGITVTCNFPDRLSLSEGEAATQISGTKNDPQKLYYKISVDEQYSKIKFIARIEVGGLVASAIDSIEINPAAKTRGKPENMVRKTLKGGGSVIEMRVE